MENNKWDKEIEEFDKKFGLNGLIPVFQGKEEYLVVRSDFLIQLDQAYKRGVEEEREKLVKLLTEKEDFMFIYPEVKEFAKQLKEYLLKEI